MILGHGWFSSSCKHHQQQIRSAQLWGTAPLSPSA